MQHSNLQTPVITLALVGVSFLAVSSLAVSPSAHAASGDMILLVSANNPNDMQADVRQYIIDALDRQDTPPIFAPIPRHVFDRMSKEMKRLKQPSPLTDGVVTEVPEKVNQWHVVVDGVTPKEIALRVRKVGNPEITDEVFTVAKQGTTVGGVPPVAQEIERKTVLLRLDDSWEVDSYQLRWEGKQSEWAAWPKLPPTYIVVIPDFDRQNRYESFIAKLREGVAELLEVERPERPLKLVAIDLKPEVRDISFPLLWKNNYAMAIPIGTNWRETIEPLAWMLFPLTAEEKDKVLDDLRKLEADPNVSGQITAAQYVLEHPDYPVIKVEPPVDNVEGLPAGMPQPSARVSDAMSPKWFELPPWPVPETGTTPTHYARTIQFKDVSFENIDGREWGVLVYARWVNEQWRAGQPSEVQQAQGTKYSTTVQVPSFTTFMRVLREGK